MANPMTYSSLTSDVQTWMENSGTDFVAQIPNFIMAAEFRLSRDVDPIGFESQQASAFTANSEYLSIPTNTKLINYLNIIVANEKSFLQIKPLEYCQEYWPNSAITGTPKYFANFTDDVLLIVPTPDSGYTCQLGYTANIAGLSANTTTNWYSNNAPYGLFYGVLSEANLFTKNIEDYSIYNKKYTEAVVTINNQARRRRRTDYKFPGSPLGENTITGGQ